jgi:hypothetical protein
VSDTAQINQLSPAGAIVQTYSVTPTGQLPVTLPATGRSVTYRLVARRGGNEVTRDLTIQITCATSWFFGDSQARADDGCPSGPAQTGIGALQLFERGLMAYVNISGQNLVYGLNATNLRYMVYANGWDGVSTYVCPCGSAPPGLFDAQGIFNWAYVNTNGATGPWYGASGIGWGVTVADSNNVQTIQYQQSGTAFYLQLPGYGVVRLSGEQVTGSWSGLGSP